MSLPTDSHLLLEAPPYHQHDDDDDESICSEPLPFAVGALLENNEHHDTSTIARPRDVPQPTLTPPAPPPHYEVTTMAASSRAWSSITTTDLNNDDKSTTTMLMMHGGSSNLGANSADNQASADANGSQQGLASERSMHSTVEHDQDFRGPESMMMLESSASSILPPDHESLMMGQSSHLPDSGMMFMQESKQQPRMNFSSLMRQAGADESQVVGGATIIPARMPMLPEEEDELQQNSPHYSYSARRNNSSNGNWLYNWVFGSPSSSRSYYAPLSPSYLDERVADHHGSSSAVHASRLAEHAFQVTMVIQNKSTTKDVMDVIGNPDLLRLWCDPVRALVITKSSEGSRNAIHRQQEARAADEREYEGEWIEATTSALVSPSRHNNCIYSVGRALWTCLGFPSYGRITMFVERLKGRVGLTIGPFSGGLLQCHSMQVVEQADGRIVITDKVQLTRDEEFSPYCCGLCDCFTSCSCCTPRLAGHMDQAVSSMRRLGVLVEHGGAVGRRYVAPGAIELGDEVGVSSVPLLA